MIDPVLLRENPDLIRRSQEARRSPVDLVDQALDADRDRRAAITAFEELRAEQNVFGKRVAKAPKEEKAALVAEVKGLSDRVKKAQQQVSDAEKMEARLEGLFSISVGDLCVEEREAHPSLPTRTQLYELQESLNSLPLTFPLAVRFTTMRR